MISFLCNPLKLLDNSYQHMLGLLFWFAPNKVFSCVSSAAQLAEPQICYILDGILFLYGIILTALYCRIKVCLLHICPFYRNKHGQGLNSLKSNIHHKLYICSMCQNRVILNGNEPFILHCLSKFKM